jgi:hypothetical protein
MKIFKNHQNIYTLVAWIVTLLISSLSLIIWRQFWSNEPFWWPWLTVGLLLVFFINSFFPVLKALRPFIIVILIIYIMGFGGGWQWGFIPYVRASTAWTDWTAGMSWALSSMATHLLRLSPAIVILLYLLLSGRSRKDLFLQLGTINAPVEPSRLIGMKKPESWTRIGTIFAIVFSAGCITFLMITARPTADSFLHALTLIPVAILIAAINAFNEEFTLRAAPLSVLVPVLGKRQSLLITTALFGLGHFYGVPNGIVGVALSAFLGWFLGKSILETKGFFWAWIIHFVQDVFIFSFFAMSA